MDLSDLNNHPDKEEIIKKLLSGVDVKIIHHWLKEKYPKDDQAHLRLTLKVLNEFLSSPYTDFHKRFSQDLADVKAGRKVEKKLADSLLNNKSYKERLNELAQDEIDLKKEFAGILLMIRDRVEQVFDKIQENPAMIGKKEFALIKWVETWMNSIEKYDKMINQKPDVVIQHNHTVEFVEKYTLVFQEAVRETLEQLDPDASLMFVDLLNEKLSRLKPPASPHIPNAQETLQSVKVLSAKIEKQAEVLDAELIE